MEPFKGITDKLVAPMKTITDLCSNLYLQAALSSRVNLGSDDELSIIDTFGLASIKEEE